MIKSITFYLMFIPFFFLTFCAKKPAAPESTMAAPPLKFYTGTFTWSNDPEIQQVEFCFVEAKKDSRGINLTGYGRYTTNSGQTNLKIRAKINAGTNYLELFESEPQGSSSFETSGVHRGSITGDYQSIDAAWTTKQNNQKGKLSLKAAFPNEFCS